MPLFTKAEDLFSHIKEYVNNRVESAKLDMADKTSRVVSRLIAFSLILLLSLFFVFFASIAFAQVIGIWTGKLYWGLLITGGIYLLIAFIVWVGKDRLLRLPIMNAILRELFNEKNNEKN